MITIAYFFEGDPIFGVSTSLKKLITNIDQSQFNLVLIASSNGRFVKILEKEGYKVIITDSSINKLIKDVFSTGTKNPLHFIQIYRRMKKEAKCLRLLLKNQKVDILHTHYHTHHPLGAMACGKSIKNIWHVRGIINPKWKYTLRWILFNFYAYCFADRIIAISNAVKASMAKPVRSKTLVIHNGIDHSKFALHNFYESKQKLEINPSTPIIGMVGRIVKIKGLHDFISMGQIVNQKHKNVLFLIIGAAENDSEKAYLETCKQKISDLGLENKFIIREDLNNPTIFMPAIDILIHPMTERWEGFGNVILEAQASGVPVIATNCGGPTDIVLDGETGYIVPLRDINAMANYASVLLTNKKLADQMSKAAQKRAGSEKFDLMKNTRQIEEVYFSILKKK